MMRVVFIGAGNLATRLSLAMSRAGMEILQVYSRTAARAEALAGKLGCVWTDALDAVSPDADLYLFALKDTALREVIAGMRPNGGLWAHTAGSMPLSVFAGATERYGVMYPLQTFSVEREVDFKRIPFFLEASSAREEALLKKVAGTLSDDVRPLSSEKRKYLHLAAVFACNFTNHMYALAERILRERGIPGEVLLPLIDETAAKVHELSPERAQTGPAVRYDRNVIDKHLALLRDPDVRDLYERISANIYNLKSEI